MLSRAPYRRSITADPTGSELWIAPHGRAALGHARLSIIDLETGDQPIANEDETAWIVVNGEFYDYERVQRQLEQTGHRLRTRSDSEIALHLYEDLGTQFVHRLRGEYAFVIWDERTRKLFAVRDRFGVKPSVLRDPRRRPVRGIRDEGVVRGRRPGALGPRNPALFHGSRAARPHTVSRRPRRTAGLLPDR